MASHVDSSIGARYQSDHESSGFHIDPSMVRDAKPHGGGASVSGSENCLNVAWEEDYRKRMNPGLVTQLLHDSVPVLKTVDWRVEEVSDGGCHTVLPPRFSSTNQHGTHQAALISLSADYTGGIALATLIRGVPVIGVHQDCGENAAVMWLASMKVRYRRPSVADLHGRCRVPEKLQETVRQRFDAGKRVLVTLMVQFTDPQGEQIAEAEMKYFLCKSESSSKQASAESESGPSDFNQKIKASARLIAGLRGSAESEHRPAGADFDRLAAGPHGGVLAEELSAVLPQLAQVVRARTTHLDHYLCRSPYEQVVFLGVGLDMRPFRLASRFSQTPLFEIDLPWMLAERDLVVSGLQAEVSLCRHAIPADFTTDDVALKLLQHPEFDPARLTLVIYEGCSMYFSDQQNRRLLSGFSSILKHRDSSVWTDMVTRSIVEGTNVEAGVSAFLSRMNELGERFVFGSDEPQQYLKLCGFQCVHAVNVQDYLGSEDGILANYQFATAGIAC